MSVKFKLFSIALCAAALGTGAIAVSAQEKAAPTNGDRKLERSHDRRQMRGGDRMMMRELRGIKLSDGQKEQLKVIMETSKPSDSSRAEMETIMAARRNGTITSDQKTRMEAIHNDMKQKQEFIHLQVMSILTPEQKQQIETSKAEREKRMAERREMRKQQKMEKPDDQ